MEAWLKSLRAAGASAGAEIFRDQADGSWLGVIDKTSATHYNSPDHFIFLRERQR